MKQRNVISVICFSIITLGIYDLFWLVSTKKELNARTKQQIPSIWLLFAPILLLVAVAIIDGIVSVAQSTSGNGSSALGIIMAIIMGIVVLVATIITPVYWFLKYSKAVHEYTNGELSTAVTFILLWILRFIGIAVIQDKFNDMIASGNMGGTSSMSMGGMSQQMPGSMPPAPTVPSGNQPVVAPGIDQMPQTVPQPPQHVGVQPPMPQPQQPVDPTNAESYGQQPQGPSSQPPVPPAGPIVQ